MAKHYRAFFVGIALSGGAMAGVLIWMLLRRAGLSTNYSRCCYLISTPEYNQLLEGGSFPSNPYLPPHLRLDKLSYLDHPKSELALPPLIDVSLGPRAHVQQLENTLPSTERTDTKHEFGPFGSHHITMSARATERYVRRRLGISDEDRAKLAEEERRKATFTDR